MAEGMARDLIAREYPELLTLDVASAGVAAMEGEPATPEAVTEMAERGIDIRRHRARTVTARMAASSSLVLTMEPRYRERVLDLGVDRPVFLLMKLGEAAGELLKGAGDTTGVADLPGRLEALTGLAESIEAEGLWSRPQRDYEVTDPIGGGMQLYRAVAARMERPITDILSVLAGAAPHER